VKSSGSQATSGFRREAVSLARLSGLLVAGQVATVAMNFVDTVMAGRLSAEALASVAVGGAVWATLVLFSMGVLMALPPIVAQLMGSGDRSRVAPVARQGFWLAQALAAMSFVGLRSARPVLEFIQVEPELVPTVMGYLAAISWGMPALGAFFTLRFLSEGISYTRPVMYLAVIGLGVNVLANLVLMYGHWGFPALGAVGVGYATAAVVWTQCIGMTLLVRFHRRYRWLALFERFDPPRRQPLSELLAVGLPIGFSFFMEISFFAGAALLMASLGTVAVAGHQVAVNFASLTFMVPLGMSMGIAVRVGHAVGRGDHAGARLAGWTGIAMALGVMAVAATIMLLAPTWIVGIYTRDAEVGAMAVQMLALAAIFQLSDGVQVSSAGALRGLKDTRAAMIITFIAYWVIGLPLGWALAFRFGLGPRGLWIGFIGGLTAAAVLLAGRFLVLSRRLHGASPEAADGRPAPG
jgi:MATE family multidrug resistance protein